MRVIISPAKKMRVDTDAFICNDLPALLPKAEVLLKYVQNLSYAGQKAL